MPIRQPTREEVGKLSDATGEGRMQYASWLRAHFRYEAIKAATTVEDLREVLLAAFNDPAPTNVKEIIK